MSHVALIRAMPWQSWNASWTSMAAPGGAMSGSSTFSARGSALQAAAAWDRNGRGPSPGGGGFRRRRAYRAGTTRNRRWPSIR